ncbi:hypothetical protein CATYP_02125 [Corynebacterium atypicum]|uniref:DUF6457 domain-containing protein n=1 Tax=Corynebacterium atypicum TaxID=191610 RepID=A0ABM5QLL9_9CORY|nr:DUF6457 domain-containing protein [Corynebacterium atypicum]AIG63673.1 hypothetical protein CATYP_02125 [Corynebacterium atypicum]
MAKDPQAVHTAHKWLVEAATQLGVAPDALTPVIRDLLDLTRDVAHGPSRPAAPLTSFLVGIAAGRELSAAASPEETTELVRAKIAELQPLLHEWAQAEDSEKED